jgi:hypothetical protein
VVRHIFSIVNHPNRLPSAFLGLLLAASAGATVSAQAPASSGTPPGSKSNLPTPEKPAQPGELPIDKRIFGVLPNYRSANESATYSPITNRRKLWIATKDSTDGPIFLNALFLASIAQGDDSHPAFGQGTIGFGHRYATGLADQLIGNYLTEGIFPVLLREDPRYFRRGHGSKWRRTWYAASRIFVTKNDSGRSMFNFAEFLGNATAAGIGNAYYPGERTLLDNVQRFWTQLATDSISQVLKEFWPDIKRRYKERHLRQSAP